MTSASRGTFSRTRVSSVSRLAIINGSVAFLAPEIGIEPLSLRPPLMRIRSIAPSLCPWLGSLPGWETLAPPTRRGLTAPIRTPKRTTRPAGEFLYGPSGPHSKAWITHRPPAPRSLLGVDSGGIVGLGARLILAAPHLRL